MRRTQSKKPVSGNATGNTTSRREPEWLEAVSQCDAAIRPSMVQTNGKGRNCRPPWPKFTANVRPLKVIVGNSVFPRRCEGIGCGFPARSPSTKSDKVFAALLAGSKLISKPMTLLGRIGVQASGRCKQDSCPGSATKYVPSRPKPTLSGEPSPRKSEDPRNEKPIRSSSGIFGASSKTCTSKRYRPAFTPVSARAPERSWANAPCDNDDKTPVGEKKTLGVAS
mmetsp:Transcript_117415/g.339466  ORF Transcript_117415/g.339466 Transcript_117415/m.339466 type:complete len:224 (-) Transcript_117415:411-1082(-)